MTTPLLRNIQHIHQRKAQPIICPRLHFCVDKHFAKSEEKLACNLDQMEEVTYLNLGIMTPLR